VRREDECVGCRECISFRISIKRTNESDGVSQFVLIDEGFQFAPVIGLVYARYQQNPSGECLSVGFDALEEQREPFFGGNTGEKKKDSRAGGNREGMPESLRISSRA
jgi:hypothetical protein